MPDRPALSWETYASGPFLSIRAGGPFNGTVTITAVADGNGRMLVEATANTSHGQPHTSSPATARRARSHNNGPTN